MNILYSCYTASLRKASFVARYYIFGTRMTIIHNMIIISHRSFPQSMLEINKKILKLNIILRKVVPLQEISCWRRTEIRASSARQDIRQFKACFRLEEKWIAPSHLPYEDVGVPAWMAWGGQNFPLWDYTIWFHCKYFSQT